MASLGDDGVESIQGRHNAPDHPHESAHPPHKHLWVLHHLVCHLAILGERVPTLEQTVRSGCFSFQKINLARGDIPPGAIHSFRECLKITLHVIERIEGDIQCALEVALSHLGEDSDWSANKDDVRPVHKRHANRQHGVPARQHRHGPKERQSRAPSNLGVLHQGGSKIIGGLIALVLGQRFILQGGKQRLDVLPLFLRHLHLDAKLLTEDADKSVIGEDTKVEMLNHLAA